MINRKKERKIEKPKKERSIKKIASFLELPKELLDGAAHIEMAGNREIIIEGCLGLMDYDENTVKLSVGKYAIKINGRDMLIKNLCDENIIIDGFFYSVEFVF